MAFYTIKELPESDRPREKLLKVGAENLSDSELLAIVLRTGTREKNALELARELLRHFGGLSGLSRAHVGELLSFKGLGKAKAVTLIATLELGRRCLRGEETSPKISSPDDVARLLLPKYGSLKVEVFGIVTLNSKGKLIISGMGKSGIIGKKIAATMASTGTPSFFLHPGEAYHGDLGMIEKEDIVLLISNSGETDEVLKLIPFLKNQKNIIVAMSGKVDSTLAKNATYHLNVSVEKEACPLQLAPTSSTTATLVMGDALAIVLMELRGFKETDFAQFHPGGSLGRRLLTRVEDVMKKEELPLVEMDTPMKALVQKISSARLGLVVVMNGDSIEGIVTDGDIRRAMESSQDNFFELRASDIMTKNPITIKRQAKLREAQKVMTELKVNSLLVVEENQLMGIVQIYDIGV